MPEPSLMPVPRIGVGAVVFRNKTVLLVRRRTAPARGLWAIPGGKLEYGETLQQAAERELLEETGVVVRAGDPLYTFDLIDRDKNGNILFHYVIVDLAADYVSGEIVPGDDALDARWLSADELATLPVSDTTLKLLSTVCHFI